MERLTFTRFVAAISVVLTHFGRDIPVIDELPWSYLLRQGSFMVSYFFVLSGFIMAAVYWDIQDRADRRAYWAARFARIYPVYLLALVFTMSLGGPANGAHPWATFALNASMVQAWLPGFALSGNPPGWSLSAEAFFYLAFPFVLPLLRAMPGVWRPVAAVALIWAVSQVGHHLGAQVLEFRVAHGIPFHALHNALHYDPLLHLNSFLVGVGAQLVVRRCGWQHPDPAPRTGVAFLMVLASSAVLTAALVLLGRGVYVAGAFLSATNGLLAPVFALFIAALSVDRSRWTAWLAAAPLVALGEMSYAVYMLQDPMREAVYRTEGLLGLGIGRVPLFYAYVAVLVAVSAVVWRWYEAPLRRVLRERLARPRASRERGAAVV